MYKKQFYLFFFLLSLYTANAQQKIPEWGTVSKEDLLMKECPLDKTAPAMILGDQGNIVFLLDDSRSTNLLTGNNGGQFLSRESVRSERTDRSTLVQERKVRTRIKIFSEKGLPLANIKISYFDNNKYEQVQDISGIVYNLNNEGEIVTTKLDKAQVFRKKENENVSSVSFSLPDVRPGSVFEYRFTITRNSFSRIAPWNFQHEIPTRYSSFDIEIPDMLKFNTQLNANSSSKPQKQEEELYKPLAGSRDSSRQKIIKQHYELSNINGLGEEPFMSGYKNYQQRLQFQLTRIEYSPSDFEDLTTNWASIANNLEEHQNFGRQVRKDVHIPELNAGIKNSLTPFDKLAFIHRFFRKNFEWDGIYDFYCLNAKQVNDLRKGSTGDINLLFLNQLGAHGIEAWPVLVSTRSHGSVLKNFPFLDQFNSMVVLAKAGEQFFIMNAADKHTPMNLVPPDVMSTEGLIVNRMNSDWIDLWDSSMIEKHNVAYMATIGNDGHLNGDAYITSAGYAKRNIVAAMDAGKEPYVKKLAGDGATTVNITDFTVTNAENDGQDLVQKFKFNYTLSNTGNYYYFRMNQFTGLNNNPFISPTRWSDIDFGYNKRIVLTTRVVLPDNMVVEALPKSNPMVTPNNDLVFTPEYYQEDNVVTFRAELAINKPQFMAAEYPVVRDFFKKMYEILNEQVVLKKK